MNNLPIDVIVLGIVTDGNNVLAVIENIKGPITVRPFVRTT